MDNKYRNGKIYKLIDNTNNNVYIGSTIQTIEKRLIKHRNDYKRYLKGERDYITSIEIIQNNNYSIELIELYPCNNKRELELMEGYYIRNVGNCINKRIEGRTKQQYYIDNIDKFKEYKKEYYIENKEKVDEKNKRYYLNNKERIDEYQKEYNKKKYTCVCGSIIGIKKKSRHERTKKHIEYINLNPQ